MKVTALIDDNLVKSVVQLSKSKNITEGLIKALEDYVYRKRIEEFIEDIDKKPLEFNEKFSSEKIRNLNRRKRI